MESDLNLQLQTSIWHHKVAAAKDILWIEILFDSLEKAKTR